ncbi:muts-related protein, family 1, partial [Clostridium botulinum CFSAN001627]
SEVLKYKKEYIMNIFHILGELEALLSISGYQKNLKEDYVNPIFTKEVFLDIKEGIHPLLDKPVANSISIKDKGIVLTGTNMSGKSTFLRMLGINILLSQTFYFALAKEYKASFFNIVSSISPNDDLSKGKSYYMAEAEGILRIVKALEKDLPVFCPIDEIFRGTNPIERIAMSAEILSYLQNGRTVSIVATHDRELVDILKDSYEFYYFSESVDSKNGLDFDYKLKVGVSNTRNAIKLLEYIGYPKKITEKAYKRAETIKGFI